MFWAVRRSHMVSLPEIWTLFFPQITAKICSLDIDMQVRKAGDSCEPCPGSRLIRLMRYYCVKITIN